MTFDIRQTEFPSDRQKAIWYCGVLVMPEALSLSDKAKALMDAELFESCRQMRLFMLHSLRAMYDDASGRAFDPYQYFSVWLNIMGAAPDENVGNDRVIFASSKNVKALLSKENGLYAGVLANAGIFVQTDEGTIEISNAKYPKMFRAMKAMQTYVREKKERASLENSFQICDFRKICPGYKYDKTEKKAFMREAEDRVPLILTGENRETALAFIAFLRSKKIKLKWTGIQNNYSETGATYGEGKGICYVGLGDAYQRGRKDGWIAGVTLENLSQYEAAVAAEGLTDFVLDNVYLCDKTPANACNGGEKSIYACHRGKDVTVLGKEVKYICRLRNQNSVSVYVHDPDEAAMEKLMRVVALELGARGK